MDESRKKHGAIGWTELMTDDVEKAKSFYTSLFGWKTEAWPMPDGKIYHVLMTADGDAVAGIMEKPPEAAAFPTAWESYVSVDDVDATAREVEALGGKILVPPMDIPQVGRFVTLQGPTGETISAITYAS